MKKIAILVSMLMIMMVSIAEAKGSKNHQKKENKKFEISGFFGIIKL